MVCDLKNISISIEGNDKAKINCDFMWEVEAITNIIKNCIEHSKENSKIIIKYEQNNIYSSISIQDFAGGIDKNDLPHIFERFYCGRNKVLGNPSAIFDCNDGSGSYKGKNATQDSIGIGLALAKTIIESDNGSIDVETDKISTKFLIKYFSL